MKPILVGLDGSALAERGLVLAANLAESLHATVIAARVVPTNWSGRAYDPDLLHRLEEADEKDAASYLAQTANRLREDRVQAQTRLLHGDAARALVAAARQDECSLIVVTSHGMSGLGSHVFGGVAQKVLASAPCPVVVVPCSESDLVGEEELEEQTSDESALRGIGALAKRSGVGA
jgi:nucleotide-binding universal stress UspA family protein